jgi:hypothetical protein
MKYPLVNEWFRSISADSGECNEKIVFFEFFVVNFIELERLPHHRARSEKNLLSGHACAPKRYSAGTDKGG